eukprot:TRINITY_DN74047_c0_g1_i1.p1 TRINITY_DN74047_c0_g1~~TRINITY_DN74047_c0_g1_i1.p1  ORF type:complete len:107 (+),score=25.77 TRINITY_DN74047_c0_g1_i1:50-322(+)
MQLVGSMMVEKKISPYNTRLFKKGKDKFELRIAASKEKSGEVVTHNGATIEITYGDYGDILGQTNKFLKEEIGRAVQQECRDRSRMPSSA